jgi:N-acetylglucosaminyldiphosphoundecaprenol N-acetyl-beta-D-mannosaminyltransferase
MNTELGAPRHNAPTVDVLGVRVSIVDIEQTLDILDRWITEGHREYVCVTGVRGVMESRRDEALRRIHNDAGLVTPHGMPLVWWSRWLGCRLARRVDGPDLLLACCERSITTGYRHFFYFSGKGVADLHARRLSRRFPALSVAGTFTPPSRPLTRSEDEDVVARINEAAPDIVWVGLGTPEQEYWMAEHVGRLQVPVLIGVGAAFDGPAFLRPRTPRWMENSWLNTTFLWLALKAMRETAPAAQPPIAAAAVPPRAQEGRSVA